MAIITAILTAIRDWWQRPRAIDIAREHQLTVIREAIRGLEVLVEGQVDIAREQSSALIEIAKANAAQAAAFNQWLSAFTQNTAAPTASVISDEEAWALEQAEMARRFGLNPDEVLPPEFQLAKELQSDFRNAIRED